MDQSKNEIVSEAIRDVKDLIRALTKKHHIKSAYIFGSYARGNPDANSDIDIAITY